MAELIPKKWTDASVPTASSFATGNKLAGLVGSVVTMFPKSVLDAVYALKTRAINTTAPLTGGGDLSTDRTLAVSDASTSAKGVVQLATPSSDVTAGHVVQANDARLSDARTPVAHTHTSADIVGSWTGKYDPDHHPSGAGITVEDWLSDTAAVSERWGNQNGAAKTIDLNSLHVTKNFLTASQRTVVWKTFGTSGNNFAITYKSTFDLADNFNLAGVALLAEGDETTPTKIYVIRLTNATAADVDVRFASATSYSAAFSDHNTLSAGLFRIGAASSVPVYMQFRYVASTKDLTAAISLDGWHFYVIGVQTLAAHPTASHGPFVEPNTAGVHTEMRTIWIVYREDATGVASPWPCGSA